MCYITSKSVEGGERMTNHAVLIGEIDLENQRVNEIFMEAWCDQPDTISESIESLDECMREHSTTVAFIRIDEVRNNGLKITRELKQKYPSIGLVWMAYGKNYALSAFDEGVDAYLELPLSHEKLIAVRERFQRRLVNNS